ncbi:hypothetical protein [Methanofollis fontis]|nr:hypothetical protein [Methanofollis fontis]
MFGDRTTTPNAREEQGVSDLPRYLFCALVPSPYEGGPAYALLPRRDA